MLQIEDYRNGGGILNLECVVRPPGKSRLAIPLEATFKTMLRFKRKAADSVFHMKVPVPPKPYKKNTPHFCSATATMISLRMLCYSSNITGN